MGQIENKQQVDRCKLTKSITLNVNNQNTAIKRQRLSNWIFKKAKPAKYCL